MVRVAGLKQQLSGNVAETPPDGLTAAEQLAAISTRAHAMVALLYDIWRDDIEPQLVQAGVRLLTPSELSPEQKAHLSGYFTREVWPVLTPLAVDPGHPFPMLRNRSINLAVFMHREKEKARREAMVAVVQVPSVLPRLTEVPLAAGDSGNGAGHPTRFAFMMLEDLIAMHVGELFPGFRVLNCSPFRVTRNFDLSIDEDEADDLLKTIQKELRRRERGSAVRLEIAHDTPAEVLTFLRSSLRLEADDVYLFDGPLHVADMAPVSVARGAARASRRAVRAADRAAAAGVRRHLRDHRRARRPAAPPVRVVRSRRRVHLRGGRRPERAGDQADAVPHQRRLPDRARADPRRRERQAGDRGRRAQGALRRGDQHPVGAHAGGDRRARGLRSHRPQDPLQGRARGAARARTASSATSTCRPATTTRARRGSTPTCRTSPRATPSPTTRARCSTCSPATRRRRHGSGSRSRRSGCTTRSSRSSNARRRWARAAGSSPR